ncbi:MAG TPA: DUF986 family protein [Clostridia bacterium]|nr:DUF986 family protein [Clostridia bacterium]
MIRIKKELLIIIAIFIFGIIGIIVGLLVREDILQKFFSALLVVVIFATIWDIYDVFKAQKCFGQIKWNVKTTNNYSLLSIYIYAILIPLIFNVNFKDTLRTKLLAMIFIAGIIPLVHSLIPDGINEKGIMHWGVFHTWDDINSYSFTDKYLVVTLKPNNRKITFIVARDDKETIKDFLKEKFRK